MTSQPARARATGLIARILGLALVAATLALGLAGTATAAPAKARSGGEPKPSAALLADPGTISGTVTVEDGTVFDGYVNLYRWDEFGWTFDWLDDVYVDQDFSTFSFEVDPGSYYLEFQPDGTRYQRAFSGGVTLPPTSLDDEGVITVEPGGSVVADLHAAPDPGVAEVTGTVVNGDEVPIADVAIDIELVIGEDETNYVTSAYTDEGGAYTAYLHPGDYVFYVYPDDGSYDTAAVDVTITAGANQLAPIVLTTGGRWSVSGAVSGASGPLDEGHVELYRLYGEPGDWDDWDWEDEVDISSDGTYAFSGVRGGATRYYTVRASAPGHTRAYYGGTSDVREADYFTLSGDLAGIDLELEVASSISGVVTGPGDSPAEDVYVELYRWMADEEYFESWDGAYTDDGGEFEFDSLDPGSYTLRYDGRYAFPPLRIAWLGGAHMPTGPSAPGVLTVTETPTAHDASTTLGRAPIVSGSVTDQSANPIADASVTVYAWDGGWSQFATTTTDEDGTFRTTVPDDSVVTFRVARGGFNPIFYGGGSSLPDEPTGSNSITTTDTDVSVGTLTLSPFVSKLGKLAGQRLDYCLTNSLAANDDSYTDAVELPFDLKFFGTPYDEVFVNNNGNVTFGDGQSQYTPSDLTGETNRPIIAPFFADVDTGGAGSNVVTYGASPDGNTFCVNWADVGYYDERTDKLNTFQLLLTKNTGGAGRVAGDFDITFNYDELLWETGEASGGEDGLGGTSAAAGFSAGTGQDGTYVQLPGSFVNGALLDGGADSLVAHSQGSSQTGRYVFQVRNSGLVSTLGNLRGTVLRDADSAPVEDAYVQACRANGTGCSYAYTDEDGGYSFTALPVATYQLRVWPPTGSLIGGGATVGLSAGTTTIAPAIRLLAPTPPPPGTSITNNGHSAEGVPSVNYAETLAFALDGCAAVPNPTYTVTLADGRVIRDHLPLTESPAGRYTASIAPLSPNTGDAEISTNVPVECGGDPVVFNVYIDPSGIVTDQWGRPIQGVSVTLMRADTEDGVYTDVEDGSTVMSESNRANPSTTDGSGYFRWDVQAGWYKVRAEKAGCGPETTAAMEVPPERIDLVIKLSCTGAQAPTASAGPAITGQPKVGQTIRPTAATWPAPLVESDLELLRNGTPVALTAGGYTLAAGDVGATFVARSTGLRPDYVQEGGTGTTVTFTSVTATSTPATGAAGDPPSTGTPPTTDTPQVPAPSKSSANVSVKAPKKAKAGKKVKVTVTVTAAGARPTGKVTLRDGKKVIATVTLTAAAKGKATFKVKLKPGKHRLSAGYAGSSTVSAADSKTLTVKATQAKKPTKGKKGGKKGRLPSAA